MNRSFLIPFLILSMLFLVGFQSPDRDKAYATLIWRQERLNYSAIRLTQALVAVDSLFRDAESTRDMDKALESLKSIASSISLLDDLQEEIQKEAETLLGAKYSATEAVDMDQLSILVQEKIEFLEENLEKG